MADKKYKYHFGILEFNTNMTSSGMLISAPDASPLNITCDKNDCRVKMILPVPSGLGAEGAQMITYLVLYEGEKNPGETFKAKPVSPLDKALDKVT